MKKDRDRPVLFEFFLNEFLYNSATEGVNLPENELLRDCVKTVLTYDRFGYDYGTFRALPGSGFSFPDIRKREKTISQNEGAVVSDWESFEKYILPVPAFKDADFKVIEELIPYIPEGMKLIASGPGGIEENLISMVGYENLCFMMVDHPDLVEAISRKVGERLAEYYSRLCNFPVVGACISNDDRGFKTQTLLTRDQLQTYIFPWHQKITDTIHNSGRKVILHSCGNIYPVMDTIIDVLKYDAKHSYEDAIMPVEQAYDEYGSRIAILGGIDVDFVCQSTPEEVFRRSKEMLERAAGKGGYALGTGNSVPEYVPVDNYLAMIRAGASG